MSNALLVYFRAYLGEYTELEQLSRGPKTRVLLPESTYIDPNITYFRTYLGERNA